MKILACGFGPFDRFSYNPSEVLVRVLAEENEDLTSKTLPVVYGKAGKVLLETLEETDPDLAICFGLNGTISHIALEEIALNIRSSEVPDTSGRRIEDEPISSEGPLAFRSKIPLRKIRDELEEGNTCQDLSFRRDIPLQRGVLHPNDLVQSSFDKRRIHTCSHGIRDDRGRSGELLHSPHVSGKDH